MGYFDKKLCSWDIETGQSLLEEIDTNFLLNRKI
jgi:hypothetical protein